jgi:hypothetical protein
MIQTCWPCCPRGTLKLSQSAKRLPPHTQVKTNFQTFQICWYQKVSIPIEYRGPELPTVPDRKTALTPLSKSENAPLRFPTEGKKAVICYSASCTRSPVPQRNTEAQSFTLHLPAGQLLQSCPCVPQCRAPVLPIATAREPLYPYKRAEIPSLSLRGERR